MFVLHELALMYHELSLMVLGDIASGCGWLQQPCRADADRCGGGHLWLRQNSAAMSSPRWHVRRHGIYGCGLFRAFFLIRKHERIKADIIGPNAQSGRFPAMSAGPAHPTRLRFGVPKLSERSNHVMPEWPVRWRTSMAAAYWNPHIVI